MKSMSMVSHGISLWCWVASCSSGLVSTSRPRIHILAGEKVWHQVITPMTFGLAEASVMKVLTPSEDFRVGLSTILAGILPVALRKSTISPVCWATWRSASSP